MAVTLQDIADKCKVSRVTVSHVLRNPEHPRYSQATKQRVAEVAKELQYSPNLVAQQLKRGKTNVLGVVIPFNDPGVIDTFERLAQDLGYAVMVQFSPDPDEKAELRALKSAIDRRVDGIIWQPCSTKSMSVEKINMIANAKIPVVQIQSQVPHFPQADYVGIDWAECFKMGVRHLKECGYKKIVYLSLSDLSYEPRSERLAIFKQACLEEKIPGDILLGSMMNIEGKLNKYIDDNNYPVAFLGQEFPTLDVINVSAAKCRRIPDDIGILLIGDMMIGGKYRLGEITSIKLSAIRIPSVEIAQKAMQTLMERIRKKLTGPGVTRKLEVGLVKRESTKFD